MFRLVVLAGLFVAVLELWAGLDVNQVVREVAAARQVPVIDAAQLLGKNPELHADISHFAEEGSSAMARLLTQELERLPRVAHTPPRGL